MPEETMMPAVQTIDEMGEAYRGEWALVVDCENDESGWLVRGRVVAHSPDRADIYAEMANHPEGGAIEYLGDEDPVLML